MIHPVPIAGTIMLIQTRNMNDEHISEEIAINREGIIGKRDSGWKESGLIIKQIMETENTDVEVMKQKKADVMWSLHPRRMEEVKFPQQEKLFPQPKMLKKSTSRKQKEIERRTKIL